MKLLNLLKFLLLAGLLCSAGRGICQPGRDPLKRKVIIEGMPLFGISFNGTSPGFEKGYFTKIPWWALGGCGMGEVVKSWFEK